MRLQGFGGFFIIERNAKTHTHPHLGTHSYTHSYKMQTLTDVTSYHEKGKEAFKIKWPAGNTVHVSVAFDTI